MEFKGGELHKGRTNVDIGGACRYKTPYGLKNSQSI